VSNAGAVGTNRNSEQIAGYQSMTSAVCGEQLMVFHAVVYNSYGTQLFIAQHKRIRQRVQYRIYLYAAAILKQKYG